MGAKSGGPPSLCAAAPGLACPRGALLQNVRKRGRALLLARGTAALSAFDSRDHGLSGDRPQNDRVTASGERCVRTERAPFTLRRRDGSKFCHLDGRRAAEHGPARGRTDGFATTSKQGLWSQRSRAKLAASHPDACPCARRASVCRSHGGGLGTPQYPLDIARVGGATVLAVPTQGIVRVASSRDDGRTWTPFSVAFDPESQPSAVGSGAPERLLVVGARVLLHGIPRASGESYPVLFSDDQGASWRGL